MRPGRAFAVAALLACGSAAAADGILVAGPAGQGAVTLADLEKLSAVTVDVSFGTEHGPRHSVFAGPLLWTVLDQAGAIDTRKPRESVRQIVTIAGADGYTAVLALGEISPEFEAKQVILAEQMDGKPLGAGHLRLVVPGDKRGGRGVQEVVRITVSGNGS